MGGLRLSVAQLVILLCYLISSSSTGVLGRTPQPQTPRSPCPRAIKINTNYHYRNALHFICLQLQPNSRPRLDVIQYSGPQLIWSQQVDEFDTNQLASFVDDEGTLRIMLANPHRLNGTSMYSIDASGLAIKERHTINTQMVSTLSIWKLELNWEWHLAIANQPFMAPLVAGMTSGTSRSPLPQPGPMISIHSWRATYFDQYQLIELPYDARVNKLEPMHINDQEYLIVALESNSHGRDINSLIYKLDFGDGTLNWLMYQNFNTKLALDASPFKITHRGSLQRDYYIALIGQPSRHTNQHASRPLNRTADSINDHGLIMYKYFGDKFVKTHSISVPGATKLQTISYGQGDSYVVVALLSSWSKQISLFLFDGLDLKPLPSPPMGRGVHRPMHPSFSRYRRTMDTDSLHLFAVPPINNDNSNDTSIKRTLGDDDMLQSMVRPALAFSTVPDTNLTGLLNGDNSTSSLGGSDTLYQIPVHEHINDNPDADITGPTQDSNQPNKRNYIASPTGRDLLAWCRAQINSVLTDKFELLANQLDSLPRVDQARPIEVHGDLVVEGNLHISNLLYVNRIEDDTGRLVPSGSLANNSSSTFEDIARLTADITRYKNQVDQILVDDESIQEVYAPLRFDRIVFECLNPTSINPRLQPVPFIGAPACPQIGEIKTILLNSRNISDIQRQALLTGRSMNVGYDVRFEHLVLRGQTKIRDTLNGIPIQEIVFGRGLPPGTITGHKNFRNSLFSTADILVDSWNGMQVNRQTTLTSTGEQRIEADLRFSRVLLDSDMRRSNDSSRIELLNTMYLDAHLNQIAQADESNNFELPIEFDELIINGPTHFPADSHLASINIENLWSNTMFKHSHQNVSAPMHFAGNVHVSYGGDILVNGLINGVHLTPENVMMRNRNYKLTNPIVVEGNLNIRLMQVNLALNGIQSLLNYETGQKELAILYDGGRQEITSDKILGEIHLGGNTEVRGAINGHLNLTQLYNLARNDGQPFKFGTVRLRGSKIRVADRVPIHVASLINGVPVNDICGFAEHLVPAPVSSYKRLRFEQPIVFKSLRCTSINGFNDLRRSFLMKQGNQRVAGTLKLVNGVVFNSTVNVGSTFNSLSVAPLAKAIAQVINESRTGHKDFYGDLYVDDLFALQINELPLANVFFSKADHPQIITAPMSFDHLDIENVLVVGRDLNTYSFNGLNLSDIITNTLQYDSPQIIYNHVELDHLHILPGSNLFTKSLNGHDLGRLYSDAVLVDAPQQILAPKNFRGHVEFTDRVFLRYGIDGLSENELKFNLLLQSDELIDDDLEFNNDVTIMKSLEIQTGIINDMDVNLFVNSMLYENRPNGMRVLGNSSLRFKDVKLNNLVLTGTIQGFDLSRDALQRTDNVNGSYNPNIRQQQIWNSNQQIFNKLYNSGSTFRVQTKHHNESFIGSCQIHSCPQTTPYIPILQPQQRPQSQLLPPMSPPPPRYPNQVQYMIPAPYSPVPWTPRPVVMTQQPGNWNSTVPTHWVPQPPTQSGQRILRPNQQQQQAQPLPVPQTWVRMPNIMPRPMALINTSSIVQVWRPTPVQNYYPRPLQQQQHQMLSAPLRVNETNFKYDDFALVDPQWLEYQANLKANAIKDLAHRVNRYLSVSFYYEIVQKHPLLGPVLHAADNPIQDEEGNAWLLLKAASKRGEPCLQRGQKIDVMAQQRGMKSFTVSSRLQETSNPYLVESIHSGRNHYLFVADTFLESLIETMSQLLIYQWDYSSGMYDLRHRIPIDGFPTTMKAFVVNQQLACVALANPRVVQSNHSGAPLMYCQQSSTSDFNQRLVLPLSNIFDLDILALPESSQVIVAALSQQDTEQVGDLLVVKYDFASKSLSQIANRRTARPLKLHFVKQTAVNRIQLVVSEGITSNNAAQAITRIFSLHLPGPQAQEANLIETQIIRDNQFTDIQSIILDNNHAMIYLKSTHSISIYAPMSANVADKRPICDNQFALIQRLPTKGANKFLVFNNNLKSARRLPSMPFGHILVLSRDDCEHQQYSTVVLKPKFK